MEIVYRRFQALYVSENLVPSGGEIDELVGHTYLYLKEQLESLVIPPSSILHGTIIGELCLLNVSPSMKVKFFTSFIIGIFIVLDDHDNISFER